MHFTVKSSREKVEIVVASILSISLAVYECIYKYILPKLIKNKLKLEQGLRAGTAAMFRCSACMISKVL